MSAPVNVNDSGWATVRRKLAEAGLGDPHARVGILRSHGGDEVTEDGLTLVEIASIHEFGSEAANVPERSFLRATFRQKADEQVRVTRQVVRDWLLGRTTLVKALSILGTWGAAEVKNTIRQRRTEGPEDQANAPSTIARKGSSLPLVDSARMLNSISFEVVQS